MKGGWVYIMTNAPFGTLYVGVTSDLVAHDRIDEAIAREKSMKAWKRQWKTRLVEQANPDWSDLFERING